MTLFGVATRDIVKKALKSHPKSLIARSARSGAPVYQYIHKSDLHGCQHLSSASLGRSRKLGSNSYFSDRRPRRSIVPNAGLISYRGWMKVIQWCHMYETPFAVTEYAEQSAELQRSHFPMIVSSMLDNPLFLASASKGEKENIIKQREYVIAFNPFQRPGQRTLMSARLPSVPNGFTMRVVGCD